MNTLLELKAWLEGFEEGFGSSKTPNIKQWRKIKRRINTLYPVPVAPVLKSAGKSPAVTPSGVGAYYDFLDEEDEEDEEGAEEDGLTADDYADAHDAADAEAGGAPLPVKKTRGKAKAKA